MAGYALAHLRRPQTLHPDVLRYLEGIQATLDPYGGHFLVHGGAVDVREGSWPGDLVIIEFPDLDAARSWYESTAYQQLKPLRSQHLAGEVILAEGVEPDHDSAHLAAAIGSTTRPR